MGDMADYYADLAMTIKDEDDYFEEAQLLKEEYRNGIAIWETKNGNCIKVSEMKDDHIINTYNYLKRIAERNYLQNEWIEVFKQEIVRRKIK